MPWSVKGHGVPGLLGANWACGYERGTTFPEVQATAALTANQVW